MYEYYFSINNDTKVKKEEEKNNDKAPQKPQDIPPSERPWADLMYQLGLTFSKDAKDDITRIQVALKELEKEINDDEASKEIDEIIKSVDNLYTQFINPNTTTTKSHNLANELETISYVNWQHLNDIR